MANERHLRRKLTLRAHGEQVVFVKQKHERIEHVWMKAFLWALYLPSYPELSVEVGVGERYKPDVVALNSRGEPTFWGEAGAVSEDKLRDLPVRYRRTHLALAKWNTPLDPFAEIIEDAVGLSQRFAPFDLLRFNPGDEERYIDERGRIRVAFDDIQRRRLAFRS